MGQYSFNLVTEPWIPCVDLKDAYFRLGLVECLERAHELRGIELGNPLEEAAIFRVLLAVVHRAVDGPKDNAEWKELYKAGEFDSRVSVYLDKWKDRFDLFSETDPFYQTSGLTNITKSKEGSEVENASNVTQLMLELASGNNRTLFDHTLDAQEIELSASDAACVLIAAQQASLQGLNKKTSNLFGFQQSFLSAVLVGGIFVNLTGKNMFETLLLNLLVLSGNEPLPSGDTDCPVWEREDIGHVGNVVPRGYLDYLTAKCRHIRLVPESNGQSVVVRHAHIAQGEAFKGVLNPACIRKQKKDGTWIHAYFDPDRSLWRDSSALFAFGQGRDDRPKVFRQAQSMRNAVAMPSRYICTAYSLANDQASPVAWRKERLAVPAIILEDETAVAYLMKAMDLVGNAGNSLRQAIKFFFRVFLTEGTGWDVLEKEAANTGAEKLFWDTMDGSFQQFLNDIGDPDAAIEKWKEAIKRSARHALDTCVDAGGGSVTTYRAIAEARSYLHKHLAQLGEQQPVKERRKGNARDNKASAGDAPRKTA